jgi:hypothetical protein
MKTHRSDSKNKTLPSTAKQSENTGDSKNRRFQNQQSHWRFPAGEKKNKQTTQSSKLKKTLHNPEGSGEH